MGKKITGKKIKRKIDSPIGPVTLLAEHGAIVGIYFGDICIDDACLDNACLENACLDNACFDNACFGNAYSGNAYSGDHNKHASCQEDYPVLDQCEQELSAYFAGELQRFTTPIQAKGTPFREKVWEALCQINYGETASYKDIAIKIGNPKSVRAVGGANHNNPISIIIPCHRVIGADGSLTGYGGGLEAKKWLLELEEKRKAVVYGR